jgi:Kdo2-lipid IVA lauroyltransferase/acyltransferase
MFKRLLTYFLIRAIIYPLSFLSYRALHKLGTFLGEIAFFCLPKFRKRALSNLSLAPVLKLQPEQIETIARESFHNLLITYLEYPKLAREKNIARLATCETPEPATTLVRQGKGIIFFCGHQANWEILFLEGTSRMPGVAIGRPLANPYLYQWVVKIREKFGGKIIEPKNAFKEGLRALKRGAFLGIVGDQGMPDSGFATDFLGRKAYTSTLPALLAYRSGAPLLVATLFRKEGRYQIRYSEPLYADPKRDMHEEVSRLMHSTLAVFEETIKEHPSQWLWQHNRWKLQRTGIVRRMYRYDALCIALPKDPSLFDRLWPQVLILKDIFPDEHFTLLLPEHAISKPIPFEAQSRYYNQISDLFVHDYAPKLLLNFTGDDTLSKHYQKLSVIKTMTLNDFELHLSVRKTLCKG